MSEILPSVRNGSLIVKKKKRPHATPMITVV